VLQRNTRGGLVTDYAHAYYSRAERQKVRGDVWSGEMTHPTESPTLRTPSPECVLDCEVNPRVHFLSGESAYAALLLSPSLRPPIDAPTLTFPSPLILLVPPLRTVNPLQTT